MLLADTVYFPFQLYAPVGMDAGRGRCDEFRQTVDQPV